eukprot:g12623.t1
MTYVLRDWQDEYTSVKYELPPPLLQLPGLLGEFSAEPHMSKANFTFEKVLKQVPSFKTLKQERERYQNALVAPLGMQKAELYLQRTRQESPSPSGSRHPSTSPEVPGSARSTRALGAFHHNNLSAPAEPGSGVGASGGPPGGRNTGTTTNGRDGSAAVPGPQGVNTSKQQVPGASASSSSAAAPSSGPPQHSSGTTSQQQFLVKNSMRPAFGLQPPAGVVLVSAANSRQGSKQMPSLVSRGGAPPTSASSSKLQFALSNNLSMTLSGQVGFGALPYRRPTRDMRAEKPVFDTEAGVRFTQTIQKSILSPEKNMTSPEKRLNNSPTVDFLLNPRAGAGIAEERRLARGTGDEVPLC